VLRDQSDEDISILSHPRRPSTAPPPLLSAASQRTKREQQRKENYTNLQLRERRGKIDDENENENTNQIEMQWR